MPSRVYRLRELLSKNFYEKKLISPKEYNIIKDTLTFLKTNFIEAEDVDGNIVKSDKQTVKKLKEQHNGITNMLYDNRTQISNNIKTCTTDKSSNKTTAKKSVKQLTN